MEQQVQDDFEKQNSTKSTDDRKNITVVTIEETTNPFSSTFQLDESEKQQINGHTRQGSNATTTQLNNSIVVDHPPHTNSKEDDKSCSVSISESHPDSQTTATFGIKTFYDGFTSIDLNGNQNGNDKQLNNRNGKVNGSKKPFSLINPKKNKKGEKDNKRFYPSDHHHSSSTSSCPCTSSFSRSLGISLLVLIIATVVLCILFVRSQNYIDPEDPSQFPYVKPALLSSRKFFSSAAVTTDTAECAPIGRRILEKGGHAVDAAISVLLCMGVVIPESLGLGGGSFWTIFQKGNTSLNGGRGQVTVIDAREEAPSYATPDMFSLNNSRSASYGMDAIGVPGELAAYWTAHQAFGKLPWKVVVQPAIDLAREGFVVGSHLENALKSKYQVMERHEGEFSGELKKIFTDPDTGEPWKKGSHMKREDLAQTLKLIQREGASTMYSKGGKLLTALLSDLNRKGSKLTEDDFIGYQVRKYVDVIGREISLGEGGNNITIYSSPLPSSGPIFGFIIETVVKYFNELKRKTPALQFSSRRGKTNGANEQLDEEDLLNRVVVETWKFAYAQRALLGDPDYEAEDDPTNTTREAVNLLYSESFSSLVASVIAEMKETVDNETFYYDVDSLYRRKSQSTHLLIEPFKPDQGTAAMSIIDSEGNAVSVTSTVNGYFGSLVLSPSTGIILNNEMDDFASDFINQYGVKGKGFNRVKAGKRPMSSMCPSILTRMRKVNVRVGDEMNSTESESFEEEEVILTIGASGGTQITTSTSMATLKVLLNNSWIIEDGEVISPDKPIIQDEKELANSYYTLGEAIDAPRLHHQLWPMKVRHEDEVLQERLNSLRNFGHVTQPIVGRGSIVMGILRVPHSPPNSIDEDEDEVDESKKGKVMRLEAVSDFRKGGDVDGF